MRTQLSIALLILVSIFVISCDNCGNLDCMPGENLLQLRLLNNSNGEDLLFGPNKAYNSQDLKFYSLNGNDTIPLTEIVSKAPAGLGYDSSIFVQFHPNSEQVYMHLNNSDTDTIAVSFHQSESKCCGSVAVLDQFLYNNTTVNSPSYLLMELRK